MATKESAAAKAVTNGYTPEPIDRLAGRLYEETNTVDKIDVQVRPEYPNSGFSATHPSELFKDEIILSRLLPTEVTRIMLSVSLGECWEPPPEVIQDITKIFKTR
jgi:hypothetical protein